MNVQVSTCNCMESIGIKDLARGNQGGLNSIHFYFPSVKDGDKEINKGFEYKVNPEKEQTDRIKTQDDLLDTAS